VSTQHPACGATTLGAFPALEVNWHTNRAQELFQHSFLSRRTLRHDYRNITAEPGSHSTLVLIKEHDSALFIQPHLVLMLTAKSAPSC
jgi:hypothetical protein